MRELFTYFSVFMDWVVGPVFFLYALILYIKHRKTSVLIMLIGVGVCLIVQFLKMYAEPSLQVVALAIQGFGVVLMVLGLLKSWPYMQSVESNQPLEKDA